ncbi:NIPSNAP family protein [Algoriphagus persicinus]|uniref:NIPSNAP family protein n=1 Tax=Algoriphagus persicinus TaxID=3108754 RepID=UPI002B3E7C8F|nr:NIPSNAP family protein [Algoriphagus sp. E1-3-M2]MEB2783048.1 NIPSNAP family protein [Algoriphagus sp. E1-3-M2]
MRLLKKLSFSLFAICLMMSSSLMAQKRDFYELRTYHIENAAQEAMLDDYLANAFIPAAHRHGIAKVGVFKPVASQPDAGKTVYLFVPFKSMKEYLALDGKLAKDQAYQAAGSAYINAAFDKPPYKRIETSILQAMTAHPKYAESALTSPKKDRIYELRSYEGPTERLYKQKVKMFNSGEMDIFSRLNCSPIFYGETIAGANMPNLMYLTTHENMEIRNEHWKQFGADPAWAAMKDLPEYQNTVSRNDTRLLYPAEYSDL